MNVLDGKKIAAEIRAQVKSKAAELSANGNKPTISIISATRDPQAHWYIRNICRAAQNCSIEARSIELDPQASTEVIANELNREALDPTVHGIILQTPLDQNVDIAELIELIPIQKDIDGASPLSAGRLAYGLPTFAPATADAVIKILDYYNVSLSGQHVVVVGRSQVVGKPVAQLALQRNATVTICHSKTAQLNTLTSQADILIVAVGKPGIIEALHVSQDAVVIDVGTNVTTSGTLVGDVSNEAGKKVQAITPVPGGVGPVTTAIILQHTVDAVSKHFSGDYDL